MLVVLVTENDRQLLYIPDRVQNILRDILGSVPIGHSAGDYAQKVEATMVHGVQAGNKTPEAGESQNSRLSSKRKVAQTPQDLYDSFKVPETDHRHDVGDTARAMIAVAFLGGMIWFLLWTVVAHF